MEKKRIKDGTSYMGYKERGIFFCLEKDERVYSIELVSSKLENISLEAIQQKLGRGTIRYGCFHGLDGTEYAYPGIDFRFCGEKLCMYAINGPREIEMPSDGIWEL